jgi:hypothetical protein
MDGTFGKKLEGSRTLGRTKYGWEGVKWVYVAQDLSAS